MRKKWKKRIEELEARLKNAEEQNSILEFRQRAGNRQFIITQEMNRGFFRNTFFALYIETVKDKMLIKEKICDLGNDEKFILIGDRYLEIWGTNCGEKRLGSVYEIDTYGNVKKLPRDLYIEAKYPRSAKMKVEVKIK